MPTRPRITTTPAQDAILAEIRTAILQSPGLWGITIPHPLASPDPERAACLRLADAALRRAMRGAPPRWRSVGEARSCQRHDAVEACVTSAYRDLAA